MTIYQCINFFVLKKNLFDSNKYLFGSKIFCLNEINFNSFKQIISLNQRKSFKQIIFFDSIKSFFFSVALESLKIKFKLFFFEPCTFNFNCKKCYSKSSSLSSFFPIVNSHNLKFFLSVFTKLYCPELNILKKTFAVQP